jgi:hypothetical protein
VNKNATAADENNDSNVDPDTAEFRRQHFDRSSILRHSKKRKKSSASNPSSVTGTPAKINGSKPALETPFKSATPVNGKAVQACEAASDPESVSPVHPDTPEELALAVAEAFSAAQKEEPADATFTSEIMDVDQPDPVTEDAPQEAEELKPEEPMSASARVAALLAGPAAAPEPCAPAVEPPASPIRASPETLPSESTSHLMDTTDPVLDEIPDDGLIHDISPLPTPPPTPPPSEIPSILPEPVTPPAQTSMGAAPTSNGMAAKKNIVVTSTPLAKQESIL